MLKAGLIGFGGITGAHINGYTALEKLGKVRLTCAYDIDPAAFTKNKAINLGASDNSSKLSINFYTDLDKMLANEELDFVDICVPTYKHKELTILLLNRGYNVLCEKPMALCYDDCVEMIEAAKKSGKELMIAQCLRFFPEYDYIKQVVDDGRYGKVLSAFFARLSPPPTWGWNNWFLDYNCSGGCLTDMHIHDVDMARYLFGEPEAASCIAKDECSRYASAHTALIYNGIPVTAIGDWTRNGVPFTAECCVSFEGATVMYKDWTLKVYPKDGSEPFSPDIRKIDGYMGEIEYFCEVVSGSTKNTRNPAESAATTLKLIEVLIQSADKGGEILPFVK